MPHLYRTASSNLVTALLFVGVWLCGFLTAEFGVVYAGLVTVVLLCPAYLFRRLQAQEKPAGNVRKAVVAVTTVRSVGAAIFTVRAAYDRQYDRLHAFEKECRSLQRKVAANPAFRDVEVLYTTRKGGHLYLEGEVGLVTDRDALYSLADYATCLAQSGRMGGVTCRMEEAGKRVIP